MTKLTLADKTRHGRDKALSIFGVWIRKYFFSGAAIDDPPPAHNYDAIADMAYNTEVVRDKEIADPKAVFQVTEQVQDLSLD
ncbi:hypothetical protein SAMN05216525_13082 [Bradyrhizobium sp. Gha]|nr:hypothetical protein SAMN05216525_13082 [Bradyrhizobium sp. Gha]